ncbi:MULTISPECIES: hypothetical protein [Corynebacterium]|uniref:hypothetical protein n=1 Tax=Corynebacterium TaxID=1716 RepID=UPI001FEE0F4F|nr:MULTISPECIES: hypothetical protein [Corynebacterium]MCT1564494.1 hypothetical protein [Corynebacterium glucuronolyticum]
MSRPKAVLWDMDGTLIDTEPLWGKATFELGELLGRPLTPEVRAKTIGGSFPNTLSVVAEWAGYELKDGDLERYRTWMFAIVKSSDTGCVFKPARNSPLQPQRVRTYEDRDVDQYRYHVLVR